MTAYSEWWDHPGGYTSQFIDSLYSKEPRYSQLIQSEASKAVEVMSANPNFEYEAGEDVIKQLPIVPHGELLGGIVDETALNRFNDWVQSTIDEMTL